MQRTNQNLLFQSLSTNVNHFISSSLKFCYIIEGGSDIRINQHPYSLEAGSIFILPPFSSFSSNNTRGHILLISFAYDSLEFFGWNPHLPYPLILSSTDAETADLLKEITSLFANCYVYSIYGRASLTDTASKILLGKAHTFMLKHLNISAQKANLFQHLFSSLEYIYRHHAEDLTTEFLAQREFFSASYFSHQFKALWHTSVVQYISEVRLHYACQDMLSSLTSNNISFLAQKHGFKNSNTFINTFRKFFGVTPGKYVKNFSEDKASNSKTINLEYLTSLSTIQNVDLDVKDEHIQLSAMRSTASPFTDYWKNLLNVAFAKDLLIEPLRSLLRRIQEDIGFRYIHFHGIFNPDMYVYEEAEDGSISYSFYYLDWVFDFLHSIHLKPMVDIGNMPYSLARNHTNLYFKQSYFSTFNDRTKWINLVKTTIQHFVDRYGLEEVKTWYFHSFPLLPNQVELIGLMPEKDFYDFYETTRFAVKTVNPELRFGGPGSFASEFYNSEMMHRFMIWAQKRRCLPDYYTFRCYPSIDLTYDLEFGFYSRNQKAEPVAPSSNPDYIRDVSQKIRLFLEKYGEEKKEIWFEECNSTIWQRDPVHDAIFKASWLAKNLCDCMGLVHGFGIWMLTDMNEEHDLQVPTVFSGIHGMFSINGIPKSIWRIYEFFQRMHGQIMKKGKNWIALRNESSIQILMYHYCHYNTFHERRELLSCHQKDINDLFVQENDLHVSIELEKIQAGTHHTKKFIINQESGSAFDAWLKMGAPAYLTPSEEKLLLRSSIPRMDLYDLQAENNMLYIKTSLQPHEVQLWEISL